MTMMTTMVTMMITIMTNVIKMTELIVNNALTNDVMITDMTAINNHVHHNTVDKDNNSDSHVTSLLMGIINNNKTNAVF